LTFDKTKVVVDVGVTRLRDELGMTFGVDARLVAPRVQGGVSNVVDLLAWCHVMIWFHGIRTSTAEGITGVAGFYELQGIHVRLDVRVGLLAVVPLAFPDFLDAVPFGAKLPHFLLGFVVDIIHGTVAES